MINNKNQVIIKLDIEIIRSNSKKYFDTCSNHAIIYNNSFQILSKLIHEKLSIIIQKYRDLFNFLEFQIEIQNNKINCIVFDDSFEYKLVEIK